MFEFTQLVKNDKHIKISIIDFGEEKPEISEEFKKKLNEIRKGEFSDYENVEAMLKDLGLKA